MIVVYQAPLALLVLFLLALAAAAGEDLLRRQISNIAVLVVALSGIAAFAMTGHALRLWEPLLGAIGVLAVGTFLFARGALGGGDVKLIAATCFWFTARGLLPLLVAIVLAGGVMAVLAIIVRLARGTGLRQGGGLPYAVAIAAGAIYTAVDARFF